MKRILWRSWSKLEAEFELNKLRGNQGFQHEWINGHLTNPTPNDIYLTTNGYDYCNFPCRKATWYAESFTYLDQEYRNYDVNTNKWDMRFHFNPNYCQQPRTMHHQIMTWWKDEKQLFDKTSKNKQTKYMFGMCLSKKPAPKFPSDWGHYRTKVVDSLKDRSFKYHGSGWDINDPNYQKEKYVNGHRGTPLKFNDARILLTDCKFVWTLENSHDEHYSKNYLTEKIFHGFLSASIPIYLGCCNIHELISPDLFIDVRKFNYDPKAIADHCEKMPESEYQGYIERIGKFLEGKGQDFTCESRFLELDQKLAKVFAGSVPVSAPVAQIQKQPCRTCVKVHRPLPAVRVQPRRPLR
jgi:hypothetical protein